MPPRRRAARRSTRAAAQRSPTPVSEPTDSEMKDAPSEAVSPQEAPAEEPDDDAADDGGDEEEEEETSLPPPTPEPEQSRQRSARTALPAPLIKRRPGRPPKYPRPPPVDGSDGGSDATPRRGRGGFRGGRGFGGGRWKNKNLQKQQAMPMDNDGNQLDLENDEAVLPEDPDGEQKVDKDGYLKGGREYRVRTFTILDKGNRLYMLSTEPARCIGFRDSYLFFQKHRMLYKILLTDEDKMDLIERDLMPHSYKGRSIGVVTARSVFREFGAQIIIGGRKITDDYRVADMRAEGAVEGELAVPDDVLPRAGEEYNRNQYVAWHGASQVYHISAPTLPVPGTKTEPKKRKITVTNSNWMLEHAREASRFNSFLAAARKETNDGVYEIHTNEMHYPAIMQPTHARWEQVYDTATLADALPDTTAPHLKPNGIAEDGIPWGPNLSEPHRASAEANNPDPAPTEPSSIFPPISQYQRRNFATVDVAYVSPRYSGMGRPGNDAPAYRLPGEGPPLSEIPMDQIELLPPDCRAAFEEAKVEELKWKAQWTNEKEDGLRRMPDIRYRPA